jgi:hypothetical protein
MKRVLYIQYTNPAGYPPLEHSSRILADAGWREKLHHLLLSLGPGWTLLWRPSWVYASEALACPAALAPGCLPWLCLAYHEHDSPDGPPAGGFQQLVRWARKLVVRHA